MKFEIEIKPLTADELESVETHINFDWAAHQKHSDRLIKQEKGMAIYLVAWSYSIPVGHVLLEWSGTSDEPMRSQLPHCSNLEDLFVVAQHRSKGVGSGLLRDAEVRAHQKSYTALG